MNRQEKLDFLTSAITNMHTLSTQITEDTVFLDIGLDSLDIVELQIYYEEQTDHELNGDAQIHTVAELIALTFKTYASLTSFLPRPGVL